MGIVKISKKIEYALMSLKHMYDKEQNRLTSAREICDTYSIPFDTTAKVMQSLNNRNILDSVKGINGGYTLSKNLTNLSFLELCEVIEGEQSSDFCIKSQGICELFDCCNIKTPLDSLNRSLIEFFKNISVVDLFNQNYSDRLLRNDFKENLHES